MDCRLRGGGQKGGRACRVGTRVAGGDAVRASPSGNSLAGSARAGWGIFVALACYVLGVLGQPVLGASVTLAWDPSPGPDAAGYKLHYGAPVGNFESVTNCGEVTNFTVGDLHPGRLYGFYVTCYNSKGLESRPSNTVHYQVPGTDAVPEPAEQSVTVNQGAVVTIDLSGSDADGDPLSYAVTTSPQTGTLSGTPPNLTYRAPVDFAGADSFQFTVSDGYNVSGPGLVSLLIVSPPHAVRWQINLRENHTAVVALPGTDAAGLPLSYAVTTPPLHGVLDGNLPNLLYVPATNYFGDDDLALAATDSQGQASTVLVKLIITHVNQLPVADPQELFIDANSALPIWLTASDVDSPVLSFHILSPPAHGTLTGTPPQVVYTPDPGYVGSDQFVFQASDGLTNSLPATVTLQVQAVNQPPVVDAGPDQVVTLPGQAFLHGTITDDGLPDPTQPPQAFWSQVDGPAPALILDPTSTTTAVRFPLPGTYWLELVGSDGQLSTPADVSIAVQSLPATPTNEPPFVQYIEAESGKLTPPMTVLTNLADSLTPVFVATPTPNAGAATLPFTVPVAGDYIVWCRVLTPTPTNAAFDVTLDADSSTEDIADMGAEVFDSNWKWVLLTGRGGIHQSDAYAYSINPRVFHVAAGLHTLTFGGRDANTGLDAIAVTSDPSFDPRAGDSSAPPPRVTAVTADNGFLITWESVPGQFYQVVYKDHLSDPAWTSLGSAVHADSTITSQFMSWDVSSVHRFFSVITLP